MSSDRVAVLSAGCRRRSAFVVAGQCRLVYAALHSFPGMAGDDGFDLSNHYDAVLERRQREAALGWTVAARDGRGGSAGGDADRPDGAPLRGSVDGRSPRNGRSARRTRCAGVPRDRSPGRYVGRHAAADAGQWDLTLTARSAGTTSQRRGG